MSAALHLVPRAAVPENDDSALRPRTFADYIGQREIITNLRTSVRASRLGCWQLDHQLFTGGAGLGKTSLAGVIAAELGTKLHVTSAPSIEHRGQLAGMLIALAPGDVLFIDEIHRLSVPLQEVLYTAMEDHRLDMFGPDKRAVSLSLPKFTLLGATTHAGLLGKPLLDRFGFVWQLAYYTVDELTEIVARSARELGVAIDDAGAAEIARRSRGIPRIANRLLRRVRDCAIVAADDGALVPRGFHGTGKIAVTGLLAAMALDQFQIDTAGLDTLDRAYLTELARHGTPMGIEALAGTLQQQRATLEDIVEPFLVQLGFVSRTPRGRIVTPAGQAHLETM